MGLFVEQNSNRSKLQERLAAELQEKARRKSSDEGAANGSNGAATSPDGVEDSAYMQNTKQTTSLAWVWAIITLVAIGVVIWLVIVSLNR